MHEATPESPRAVRSERGSCHRQRDWRLRSDAELVELAGQGCDEAWHELHRRYDRLVRTIARRTGCRNAVADISQRTWELFVRSRDSIRDPSRIAGWLATTARRETIREFTRSIPQPVDVRELPADRLPTEPSPEAVLVGRETRADVRGAVGALPDTYRAIVSQFLTEDPPSYRDISSSLGCPVGSIGPMRRRGLRLIQRELLRTSAAASV